MSLADELVAIQGFLEEVVTPQGERPIQRVLRNPRSEQILSMERPYILLFCRKPSEISAFTFGTEKRVSEVVVQFVYCEDGEGLLEDTYFSVLAYSEVILDALYAHVRLTDDDGNALVNWTLPKSAGVPGTLKEHWNKKNWFGADIILQVVTSRNITYAD